MTKSCFILAPLGQELSMLPSEAQELINILSNAGWRVHLIQDPVTQLELWRALDHAPFDLGWVGTHSGPKGFELTDQTLTPDTLGDLVAEAGCEWLVLNTCFSAEHVDAIQRQAKRTDVVATIAPDGITDQEAWSRGLFLARRLARTGSLREAQKLAGPQYRWFPAPGVDSEMADAQIEERLRRIEETTDKLVRALQGETWTGQIGLITQMREWMKSDEEWKRKTEQRIETIERQRMRVVNVSSNVVAMVVVSIVLLLGLLILLVNLLAGKL